MAANSFKHLSKDESRDDDAQKDEISGKDEKETPIQKKPEETRIIPKEESEETLAEESDEPVIWQQFISEEQRETLLWTSNEEEEDENAVFLEEEELIEDDIIEEQPPFANVDYKREALTKQDEDLRVYLMGQEVYLIEEVFGGSEKKYQKALDKIVQFQDWEKAADFIQDEVFMKNKIDMYNEAAIEFIDQLQSYFKEFKN